jgi:hypothetical protein
MHTRIGTFSSTSHIRTMVRQLLPGVVLPGLIYFVVSRRAPVMAALAAASSVPLIDALTRLARRRGVPL